MKNDRSRALPIRDRYKPSTITDLTSVQTNDTRSDTLRDECHPRESAACIQLLQDPRQERRILLARRCSIRLAGNSSCVRHSKACFHNRSDFFPFAK